MPRLFVATVTAAVLSLFVQQAPPKQQRPVFRAGAHFVRVDAYPSTDKGIIEGLTADDFELFEDGKPQTIESFQFVRFDTLTPDVERRDPNSQQEGFDLAADPANRVFVLYLDTYHVDLSGSHNVRRPLVDMLNRMLGPHDLFGVLTPRQFPKDLLLGQKTLTIEEQLEKHWIWGSAGRQELDEPDLHLSACGLDALIPRRQLDRVFADLEGIIELLGNIREQRSNIVLFSDGWLLPGPDRAMVARGGGASPTGIGITDAGKLTMGGTSRGGLNVLGCRSELLRLSDMDFQQRSRDLLKLARRANVTFYPVAPSGLRTAPAAQIMADSLRTLADNTNGVAIVNTNDIRTGLERVATDLSASYVLGYYTTNTKWDGGIRQISVRLKPSGKTIRARREYRAPSEAEMATLRAATAPGTPAPPSPVETALGALSRLRPAATITTYGRAHAGELALVTEIQAAQVEAGRWRGGGDIDILVSNPGGQTIGSSHAKIEPGARSAIVRIAVHDAGPWRAMVRVRGDSQETDEIAIDPEAAGLLGGPLVYRAAPADGSPLRPVATFQFRRTERLHVEWPVLKPLDRREARLLDRKGTALPVPITVAEREAGGAAVLSADAILAPLTAGDYIIAVKAGAGGTSDDKFLAIRVVR